MAVIPFGACRSQCCSIKFLFFLAFCTFGSTGAMLSRCLDQRPFIKWVWCPDCILFSNSFLNIMHSKVSCPVDSWNSQYRLWSLDFIFSPLLLVVFFFCFCLLWRLHFEGYVGVVVHYDLATGDDESEHVSWHGFLRASMCSLWDMVLGILFLCYRFLSFRILLLLVSCTGGPFPSFPSLRMVVSLLVFWTKFLVSKSYVKAMITMLPDFSGVLSVSLLNLWTKAPINSSSLCLHPKIACASAVYLRCCTKWPMNYSHNW